MAQLTSRHIRLFYVLAVLVAVEALVLLGFRLAGRGSLPIYLPLLLLVTAASMFFVAWSLRRR